MLAKLIAMSDVLESTVTITPAMVGLNRSRQSDWAEAVWAFVEQATEAGKSVQLAVVDRSYSPSEVARLCDVSRATLNRRIADGTIKAKRYGSRWRVPETEVERYRQFLMAQTAAALADDF